VHLSDAWYLAGYCRLRQDARLFRLDRINRLEVLGERYAPGARHAVFERLGRDLSEHPEVRVRFDAEVVRWVRERQPFVLLREEGDEAGPIFVYALRDVHELLAWLLPWGRAVEVLEPDWLRLRVAEEARAIVARHTAPIGDATGTPLTTPIPAT
jgi:predicted DNA-binding transcriptional regulator YafY